MAIVGCWPVEYASRLIQTILRYVIEFYSVLYVPRRGLILILILSFFFIFSKKVNGGEIISFCMFGMLDSVREIMHIIFFNYPL